MATLAGMLGLSLLACLPFSGTVAAQEDVGSTTAAVCCGSECCNIDGTCRGRGERNPANMCQECDPGSSQSSWSPVSGCPATADSGTADTGTGGGDDGGGCSASSLSTEAAATPFALGALFGLALFVRRRR